MRDKLQSHPVVFGSSGTKSQKGSTEKVSIYNMS